jgi:L-ascorbate 6-phosphate lactonase
MNRGALALVLSILGGLGLRAGAEPARRPTPRIADEIRAHRRGLAVWWVGNAGWLIKADDVLIGTDLDLGVNDKIHEPPISPTELAELLSVAFITHHHGDHCHGPTLKVLAEQSKATLVLPQTCLDARPGLNLPRTRLIVPAPLKPFDVRGVRVEPIHAIHGDQDFTILTREPDFIKGIQHNCGYVLTIQGKRFVQPGDSVLTEEHLALQNIDVLFISPTVHNMHLDRSALLINRLEPRYVFPQHFDTYQEAPGNLFWTRGYPDELKSRLSGSLQKRFHKLRQGQRFVIP